MSNPMLSASNVGDEDEDEDEELQQMLREVQKRREKLKFEKQQAAMKKLAETPATPAETPTALASGTSSPEVDHKTEPEENKEMGSITKDPEKVDDLTVLAISGKHANASPKQPRNDELNTQPKVSSLELEKANEKTQDTAYPPIHSSGQEVRQNISTSEMPSRNTSDPLLDENGEEKVLQNMCPGNENVTYFDVKNGFVLPDDINQFPQEIIDAINYKDPELDDFGAYAIAQVSPPAIGGDLRAFCVCCAHPGHFSMGDAICPRGRIERYLKNKDGDKSIYAGFSKDDSRLMFNSDFGHLVDGAVFVKTIGMSPISDLEDFGLTTFTATHLRQLALNIVDLKLGECLKFDYEETPEFKSLRDLKCGYLTRFGKNYVGPVRILPIDPPPLIPVRPINRGVNEDPELFQVIESSADGVDNTDITVLVNENRITLTNKRSGEKEDIEKGTSADVTSNSFNLKDSLDKFSAIKAPIVGNRPKTRCTTCKLPGHVYTTVRICPAEVLWKILDKSPKMTSSQWAKFKHDGMVAAEHLRSVIDQLQRLGLDEIWGKLQETIDQWENLDTATGRPRAKLDLLEQKKRKHIPENENWLDIPPLDNSRNAKYLEYFKNQTKTMNEFEQYVRKQKLKIYGKRSDSQCSMCLHYGHDKRSHNCPMVLATNALQGGPPAISEALEYIESLREAYHWQSIFPDVLKKDTHYIELFFSEMVPNAKYQWQKDAGRLPNPDIPEKPTSPSRKPKRQKKAPANTQTQDLNVKPSNPISKAARVIPETTESIGMVGRFEDQSLEGGTLQPGLIANSSSTTLQNRDNHTNISQQHSVSEGNGIDLFGKIDYIQDLPIQKDSDSASPASKNTIKQSLNLTALAGSRINSGDSSTKIDYDQKTTANNVQIKRETATPNQWSQTPTKPYAQQEGYSMAQMNSPTRGQWTPQGMSIQNLYEVGHQNRVLPYQNNTEGAQYDGRGLPIIPSIAPQSSLPIGMVQQNWNHPSFSNGTTISSIQMVPNVQNFQNTNTLPTFQNPNNQDNIFQIPKPLTFGSLASPKIKTEKGSKATKSLSVSSNGKRPLAKKTTTPQTSSENIQVQSAVPYQQDYNTAIPPVFLGRDQQFFGRAAGLPLVSGPGQFQTPFMQPQSQAGTFMLPNSQPRMVTPHTAMLNPQQHLGMYPQDAMQNPMTMLGQSQMQNQGSMYLQAMMQQQGPMQSQSPPPRPGQLPSTMEKKQQNQGLPQLQQQALMSQQPQSMQSPQMQYQRSMQQPGQQGQVKSQQQPHMIQQTPISQQATQQQTAMLQQRLLMQNQPIVPHWGMSQQQPPPMYPQNQPQIQQSYRQWGEPNSLQFQQQLMGQPSMGDQQFYNDPSSFNQSYSGHVRPPSNLPKNSQAPVQGSNMFNSAPLFNQGQVPGNPNSFNPTQGQINRFNSQGSDQSYPPPG